MKRLVRQHDIFGMARIGYVTNLELYVNTDDGGMIPHFHLRDKTDWDKFHTCIQIEQPKYFLHEGKEDTLNSKQKKELQSFMESPVTLKSYADKFENNWELVCFLWDSNNSSKMISEDAVQPDYTQLGEES